MPQSTNRFLYDSWNLVTMLDANGTLLQSFRWGTDLSGSQQGAGGVGGLKATTIHTGTNAGTYFFAYDGNGNVMALANAANGGKAAEYEYGPFGEQLRASGSLASLNTFCFSTKFCDNESGFCYYGYRYYAPSTGRWHSRDPIVEAGFTNQVQPNEDEFMPGSNVYAFAANDPIMRIDRLGLDFWDCMGRCIEDNDPINLLAKGLLTGIGGTIPKSLVKAIGGRASNMGRGHSRFTGLPRLCQRYIGPANLRFVKWVGRIGSGAWIAYGNYMVAVEAACFGTCLGNPQAY